MFQAIWKKVVPKSKFWTRKSPKRCYFQLRKEPLVLKFKNATSSLGSLNLQTLPRSSAGPALICTDIMDIVLSFGDHEQPHFRGIGHTHPMDGVDDCRCSRLPTWFEGCVKHRKRPTDVAVPRCHPDCDVLHGLSEPDMHKGPCVILTDIHW